MNRLFVATAIVLLTAPYAAATPLDAHAGVVAGADRLLAVQNADGSMPWIVGDTRAFMNVQGATAQAFLEAYKLTANDAYLDAAGAVRDWLAAWIEANPGKFVSSSNIYFLAEHALLTANPDDLELARLAFANSMLRFGTPAATVTGIIAARNGQGNGNLGLWDAALFVRAAQDIGETDAADEMAAALATQAIVDETDSARTYYELGLAGLVFGLGEADLLAHRAAAMDARDALAASACEDGSYPITYRGEVYCQDPQTTAFAATAFQFVGDLAASAAACEWLLAAQAEHGGWILGDYEIAEVDAEATAALAGCVAPARNGATSYADAVVKLL